MTSPAKKAAQTRKRRAAGKKAATTRKRRAAGRKAAVTRIRSLAGKKAAVTKRRRKAGRKATAARVIGPDSIEDRVPRRMFSLSTEDFPDRQPLVAFEGATVYTAERLGNYYLILDETTLVDLLSEEDAADLTNDMVKVLEFDEPDERETYVKSRGWGRLDKE
jgi:hypothetical protein